MFTNQTRRRLGGLISRHVLGVAALILAAGTTTSAYAAYPDHQIKLVIPFAPGGGNDAVGRTIGKLLTESLGQPVVVENMAGAGGKIGIAYGLRSKPDGYTLTLISNSYAVNASLYQLPFDPVKDMTPIGMIAHGPFLITTTGKLPVSSLQDLIRLAKAKKGSLSFASSGVGGISHLATELFMMDAGIKMAHVPYRGTGPAVMDTLAGRTDVFFSTPGAAMPYIKNGRLKVLAQTLPKPWPEMPALPTVAQAGVPGYQVVIWYGLIAPKGLPPQVQTKLNQALNAAIVKPEVTRQLSMEGDQASPGTPEQLRTQIETEIGVWQKVVSEAHIKVD
ncbi:tripartite tricarboxylate transporter substrate binding protein [Candidimonas humi]|uniref:Tripartite tricarboxylate transporter substrate binding protein n=1 Tax=Candidimonas humi TaxID=683355 RepID=A0ABV8NUY3_9BURK|nr:tripartite tricarboxylate transporter substrate binding protein [Candidimonas humi]MBV6303548.1 tripartite tricarboxylate transporter substrate binding protein [Candidimonas humi]